ncbi:hypothetical protein G4B88_020005 [Cannabis sativa]|uniref:RNase H type-1 domain-containing protein n=1 Tax=Cannabis sativa TaxID=3483 RepID=A0A7J6FFF0_CANSA|nr:hypothetical protein G4B88_020005 [Cannabis sativa]
MSRFWNKLKENKWIHGESFPKADMATEWCFSFLGDFLALSSKGHKLKDLKAPQRWRPPEFNKLKLNVDVGVCTSLKSSSDGAVVRDHLAEFAVIMSGLQMVAELKLQNVSIVSDCLAAIQLINSNSTGCRDVDSILLDIDKLRSVLIGCSLSFERRDANLLAH